MSRHKTQTLLSLETSTKPLVMFVDDDPMILASVNRQLARKMTSIDFVFCDGGAKALAEAAKRPPDVLFSDLRMPVMKHQESIKDQAYFHRCFAGSKKKKTILILFFQNDGE